MVVSVFSCHYQFLLIFLLINLAVVWFSNPISLIINFISSLVNCRNFLEVLRRNSSAGGLNKLQGKKEELCPNYLGQSTRIKPVTHSEAKGNMYVPCIPRSFLMFLYICFDIKAKEVIHLVRNFNREKSGRWEKGRKNIYISREMGLQLVS